MGVRIFVRYIYVFAKDEQMAKRQYNVLNKRAKSHRLV
jgi:hypothetical protein